MRIRFVHNFRGSWKLGIGKKPYGNYRVLRIGPLRWSITKPV